jgi:pSer/pThr/pTyr-binding forkhead associated (FHA) protein
MESVPQPLPSLVLIHTSGQEFQLSTQKGEIGRYVEGSKMPAIDLAGLPDVEVVSRSHVEVYWDAASHRYMVVDHHSRNGTFLNKEPLTKGRPYRLSSGDQLQLGQEEIGRQVVRLRVELR